VDRAACNRDVDRLVTVKHRNRPPDVERLVGTPPEKYRPRLRTEEDQYATRSWSLRARPTLQRRRYV
jgi:hypothetical protein